MFLRIDPVTRSVTLEEPENLKALHVQVPPGFDRAVLAEALRPFGELDGEHVWLQPAALARAAEGRVPPTWQGGFEGMLGWAKSKGWTDATGRVRAHLKEG